MNRRTMSAIAITSGLALAVATPLAAGAHITIDPAQAVAGSYAVITMKVPNESETEGTTRVEVSLPTDTPFSSVRYVPVVGWSAELVREALPEPVTVGESEITEAVTSVIWTANPGSEIMAGQLQLFPLSVGPVPDTGSILLPADQTYSDGSVVSWSETGDDSEYPAPVLYINDAPEGGHHGGVEAATGEHSEAESAVAASTSADSIDVLARGLGIVGLAVGAVGIVLALVMRRAASL